MSLKIIVCEWKCYSLCMKMPNMSIWNSKYFKGTFQTCKIQNGFCCKKRGRTFLLAFARLYVCYTYFSQKRWHLLTLNLLKPACTYWMTYSSYHLLWNFQFGNSLNTTQFCREQRDGLKCLSYLLTWTYQINRNLPDTYAFFQMS